MPKLPLRRSGCFPVFTFYPRYRKQDESYTGQEKHKAKFDQLNDKRPNEQKATLLTLGDFQCACDGQRLRMSTELWVSLSSPLGNGWI